MWCLKIRAKEKNAIYSGRAQKFCVDLFFYSQNYYIDKGLIHFVGSGVLQGAEKNKSNFLKDLQADKRVKFLESSKDFFSCVYAEETSATRARAVKVAYDPRIIFLKPVHFESSGWEEWDIASPDRKVLESFVNNLSLLSKKGTLKYNTFYFKQYDISNIMIYAVMPELTDKQKQAISLAIQHGYYNYPRKVMLEQLAKMMKISLSTYRFHLIKAEAKLMPFIAKRF